MTNEGIFKDRFLFQPDQGETDAGTLGSQKISLQSAEQVIGEIIGQSRAWRQLIGQIQIVAPTDGTVLILGETGTGKELVARELHQRSRRKDKPKSART